MSPSFMILWVGTKNRFYLLVRKIYKQGSCVSTKYPCGDKIIFFNEYQLIFHFVLRSKKTLVGVLDLSTFLKQMKIGVGVFSSNAIYSFQFHHQKTHFKCRTRVFLDKIKRNNIILEILKNFVDNRFGNKVKYDNRIEFRRHTLMTQQVHTRETPPKS